MELKSYMNYESQRKLLMKEVKEYTGLDIKELLIFEILLDAKEKEVSMNGLKQKLIIQNVDYFRSINGLVEKGYFYKKRSVLDERAVIVCDIDLERMEKDMQKVSILLKKYNGF